MKCFCIERKKTHRGLETLGCEKAKSACIAGNIYGVVDSSTEGHILEQSLIGSLCWLESGRTSQAADRKREVSQEPYFLF